MVLLPKLKSFVGPMHRLSEPGVWASKVHVAQASLRVAQPKLTRIYDHVQLGYQQGGWAVAKGVAPAFAAVRPWVGQQQTTRDGVDYGFLASRQGRLATLLLAGAPGAALGVLLGAANNLARRWLAARDHQANNLRAQPQVHLRTSAQLGAGACLFVGAMLHPLSAAPLALNAYTALYLYASSVVAAYLVACYLLPALLAGTRLGLCMAGAVLGACVGAARGLHDVWRANSPSLVAGDCNLPLDVVHEIAAYLAPADAVRLSKTSRAFARAGLPEIACVAALAAASNFDRATQANPVPGRLLGAAGVRADYSRLQQLPDTLRASQVDLEVRARTQTHLATNPAWASTGVAPMASVQGLLFTLVDTGPNTWTLARLGRDGVLTQLPGATTASARLVSVGEVLVAWSPGEPTLACWQVDAAGSLHRLPDFALAQEVNNVATDAAGHLFVCAGQPQAPNILQALQAVTNAQGKAYLQVGWTQQGLAATQLAASHGSVFYVQHGQILQRCAATGALEGAYKASTEQLLVRGAEVAVWQDSHLVSTEHALLACWPLHGRQGAALFGQTLPPTGPVGYQVWHRGISVPAPELERDPRPSLFLPTDFNFSARNQGRFHKVAAVGNNLFFCGLAGTQVLRDTELLKNCRGGDPLATGTLLCSEALRGAGDVKVLGDQLLTSSVNAKMICQVTV